MIPFSPPRIDQKVIDEVVDTLKSGWITTGPKTMRFENELTEYCGNKATVCVNSATAGLQLILNLFGVKEGDEVIVPAYTYCATGNVVKHSGAKLVLVDVNNDDFNINLENIKKAITKKTKVIMPVDIGGLPCDYTELNNLVNSPEVKALFSSNTPFQEKLGRILILSDAAHSIGASLNNKKTGSLTDVSVFSFHAVKNLSTAEGGAIALNLPDNFNNEEIRKALKTKSLHGQSKDALSKMKIGAWRYDVIESGFKCNMTDIQASMGLVELGRYQENLDRRKEITDIYSETFNKKEWAITPQFVTTDKVSSYHLYMLRIKNITEATRDQIIADISENQVAVNVHFQPLPLLTAFKSEFNIDDYPVAFNNYACEISLPVYYNLTNEQAKTVVETVVASVEKNIC
jgi:dTDP-4-amino-4,6-dideoxygalactose transaminase